ncbi:(deoxy)nucleoside triphosphate pyrophosphohydrolase [Chitinivibrio alkaliphilus]|uniref:8-oxo-dGTP diphosphatase n=1 Tax=Chitinivibrio alkaliphilus ACht1 TaxID=1313304 RepID=U7D8P5_9BACT|nr:NUDIX domain-containing protein [Chitinivibrio alkaliphilus]ERP39295.1 NUDIX hydrolase [Chitinivibrio alkaliphilus ACht1]
MRKVCAAVIVYNGKVLLTKRASGEQHGGFWEFPGGKCEPGERLRQCLIREIREELSIDIMPEHVIAQTRVGDFFIHFFKCRYLHGTITLTVHDAFYWYSPHDTIRTSKILSSNHDALAAIRPYCKQV